MLHFFSFALEIIKSSIPGNLLFRNNHKVSREQIAYFPILCKKNLWSILFIFIYLLVLLLKLLYNYNYLTCSSPSSFLIPNIRVLMLPIIEILIKVKGKIFDFDDYLWSGQILIHELKSFKNGKLSNLLIFFKYYSKEQRRKSWAKIISLDFYVLSVI